VKNQTENIEFIKAFFEGKTLQYSLSTDNKWEDYSAEYEEWTFGPWSCADNYQWRIKPKTVTKEVEFTKTVTVKEVFVFEGVKESLYKQGDTVHYINFSKSLPELTTDYLVKYHNQSAEDERVIFFETAEDAQKAYNQILTKTKDSQ
jgi:hypothetical protein